MNNRPARGIRSIGAHIRMEEAIANSAWRLREGGRAMLAPSANIQLAVSVGQALNIPRVSRSLRVWVCVYVRNARLKRQDAVSP